MLNNIEYEVENDEYAGLDEMLDAVGSVKSHYNNKEDNEGNDNNLTSQTSTFSLSDNEKEELKEKIDDLRKFCVMHNVPLFVAAAYENNKLDTGYIYECLTSYDTGRVLKKDDIAQLILIKNGFKAIPKQKF